MAFWIAAGVMALVVASGIVLVLLRAGRDGGASANHDLGVYRVQLAEVERDHARGVIADDEAERMRAEVARRLLEADRRAGSAAPAGNIGTTPQRARWLGAGLVVAVVVAAFGTYARLGSPQQPDMPLSARIAAAEQARAERPSQAEAEAGAESRASGAAADQELADLVARLRTALETRRDDLRGHRLLARNEARLGNYVAARRAQARVLEILGDDAAASDHAALAEMMILAAGGYVSPEAEAALERALRADPGNGAARYYTGQMFAQTGRPDRAFRLWRELLEDSSPDAPWTAALRARLPEVAQRAGVRYSLPSAGSQTAEGPSAADLEAAADMTPEQREQMIRGMVARLSDRLAREGGPARDWARLITSYGQLGEAGRARAIWQEAQEVFAGNSQALSTLRDAAADAGVLE